MIQKSRVALYIYIVIIFAFFNGCSATSKKSTFDTIDRYGLSQNKELMKMRKEQGVKPPASNLTDEKKQKKQTTKTTQDSPPIINANIEIYNGTHKVTKLGNKKNKIKLSIDSLDIPKFSKLIFGQILDVNYIMGSGVETSKKKITLNITNEVSRSVFIDIIKKLYESNGFYIEKLGETYYIKKGRNRNTVDKNFGKNVIYGRSVPSGFEDDQIVTVLVPYSYINISKIRWMFKYFLSKHSFQRNLSQRNIYIIRDNVKNVKKALKFIQAIDVPLMKHKITKLVKLENIDVEEFTKTLKEVLPSSGINIAKDLNSLGIILKPINKLNSIFIVADKKEWIDIVMYWKNKLDVLETNSKEKVFFVYRPKNRISTELKALLDGLLSFKSTNRTMKKINKPSQEKVTKKTQTKKTRVKKTSKPNLFDGEEIKVIDDKTRNLLIIYTTPIKYKLLLSMLEKLDVLPKQVLIEVTIAELTLKDSLEYGLEWYMKNSSGTGVLSTLNGLGLGGAGLSGSLVSDSGLLQVYLNMFAQKNLIDILSSPKIVVVDNQAATLNVGTEVPVLNSSSSTVATDGAQTLAQSVEYRNTGILLSVKPTIHSNDSLMLTISQTVSEAQANSVSNISSPIVLTRNINTSVVLKSGQTLMLGGLIRENKSNTETKVPFVGDIPWLGELFKTNQISSDKTELIVMIKPIVLNTTDDANLITKFFRDLLSSDTK